MIFGESVIAVVLTVAATTLFSTSTFLGLQFYDQVVSRGALHLYILVIFLGAAISAPGLLLLLKAFATDANWTVLTLVVCGPVTGIAFGFATGQSYPIRTIALILLLIGVGYSIEISNRAHRENVNETID